MLPVLVFLVRDRDVAVMIELAIPSQLVLMTLRVLAATAVHAAAVPVEYVAAARLRVDQVVHGAVKHLLAPVVVVDQQVLLWLDLLDLALVGEAFDAIQHGLLHALDLHAEVVQLFNLAVLYQRLLSVDGCVRPQRRQTGSLIVVSNERHCVVLVHLLRARQDADHVTRLGGLLLADAWTIGARVDRLASLQGACAIHRVRVTRVGDLVG